MNEFITVIKKYAVFTGRARRREFWVFALVSLLITFALAEIEIMINFNAIYPLYLLAILLPTISVTIRRLHDINKSSWYALLILLPIIGWIWIMILCATAGDTVDNQYGENPKADEFA